MTDPSGRRPRPPHRPTLRLAAAVAVVVVFGALLLLRSWKIDYPYSIDFRVYHIAAEKMLDGRASELYEADSFAAGGETVPLAPNEFKNLPIVAGLLAPFGLLSYLAAKRLFWFLSLACLLAAGWVSARTLARLRGRADPAVSCLVTALLLAAAPAHISLRHGQLTPLAALALALFLDAALRGRHRLAGAALALTTLLKLPPLALVVREVARTRRRFVSWAVTTAVAAGISLLVFGAALHASYLDHITEQVGRGVSGHNNQSIDGILMRALGGGGLQDWTARVEPSRVLALKWILSISLAGLAGAVLLRARRDRTAATEILEMVIFLNAGLLLSPIAWDHYFLLSVLTVPHMLWAVHSGGGPARLWLGGGAIAATALLVLPTPSAIIDSPGTVGAAGQLLVAHYAAGAVGLVVVAVTALVVPRAGRPAEAVP